MTPCVSLSLTSWHCIKTAEQIELFIVIVAAHGLSYIALERYSVIFRNKVLLYRTLYHILDWKFCHGTSSVASVVHLVWLMTIIHQFITLINIFVYSMIGATQHIALWHMQQIRLVTDMTNCRWFVWTSFCVVTCS